MTSIVEHKLHKAVIGCIMNCGLPSSCEVLRDPACGGNHNLPLFISRDKSRMTRYSVVDILILKDERIKVIIEIEESDVTPIRICGKFLASALSNFYIHDTKEKKIKMDKSVTFIQICSTKNLTTGSSKEKQWRNLKESIKDILQLKKSNVCRYELLCGKPNDFKKSKCKNLVKIIKEAIGR